MGPARAGTGSGRRGSRDGSRVSGLDGRTAGVGLGGFSLGSATGVAHGSTSGHAPCLHPGVPHYPEDMSPHVPLLIATLVGVVAAIVLLVVVLVRLTRTDRRIEDLHARATLAQQDRDETSAAPDRVTEVGVVMNPSKHADPETFRARVERAVARISGTRVRFYETTVEDPGYGQAQEAVEDGAQLVIAAGGDGTVRLVAAALANTEVRMGIIPVGTGNLLARNLNIPLDDVDAAVRAALAGRDRRIDVGWLQAGLSAAGAREAPRQIFLVMSGYGADAEMIGAATTQLKKRIGWVAYVLAGINKITGTSHDVRITLPDGRTHELKARTVLIGNTGKLPGGIVLMPGAQLDNGMLEVLALGWRGAAGLSQIVTHVMNPRLSARPKLSTMERYLTASVAVAASKPQPVQLDGDTEDEATHLVAQVDPSALRIRVPHSG